MKYKLSFIVFLIVLAILGVIQTKMNSPMILLERFYIGGGWIEIFFLSLYAGFLIHKMHDYKNVQKWRQLSWLIFSFIFFSQLILGLFGFDKFLMTPNQFHFPIPGIIIGGAIYRMQISFMPILFLSTILLSGPSWCSHLCYFGALDSLASSGKSKKNKKINLKNYFKFPVLILVILIAIILREFNTPIDVIVIIASIFGIIGVFVIFIFSTRSKKMTHCISYCPVGTIIMYLKYISPFRMKINDECTDCMLCISHCKFDALNKEDILNRKPGKTCTYCGDCLTACEHNSIQYKFFNLSPEKARNLYLIVSISLHVIFLGLARL